jgi:hypothetical protein
MAAVMLEAPMTRIVWWEALLSKRCPSHNANVRTGVSLKTPQATIIVAGILPMRGGKNCH